jgi:hypothetical protein
VGREKEEAGDLKEILATDGAQMNTDEIKERVEGRK